jgi:hypothetical protein
LVSSMLPSSILVLVLALSNHSMWSFSLCGGLVIIWDIKEGGMLNNHIKLASLMELMRLHLDSWTNKRLFKGYT